MPALSRGMRTATYEILELLNVDEDSLTVTVRHAGANDPEVCSVTSANTPAARQLVRAMADSLVVSSSSDSDSRWTSWHTLRNGAWAAGVMLRGLHGRGITSFADPSLTVPVLRTLYRPMSSSQKRTACWLLARAVRDHHPNGRALAYALKNSRFEVEDHQPFTYDIETAADIEGVGRRIWVDAYIAQRELFATIGYDVSGRQWLQVSADDVLEWARTTFPDIVATEEEPPTSGSTQQLVAWALTHPDRFGYLRHSRVQRVRGRRMRAVGRALYPDNVTLVGAAIVHCLAEHAGFNVAVILEKSSDSLTYVGDNEALERSVKARGSREDPRLTRTDSIFTTGGVTQTLTGLTRFSRHHRRMPSTDGQHVPLNDRLYVEHVSDPASAKVLASERIVHAWNNDVFNKAWSDQAGAKPKPSLRLSALRLEAQRRTMHQGLTADVDGHEERTKTHYLAHVLPEHAFNELATTAQNDFHDRAVQAFEIQLVADATDGPAHELAKVDRDQILDVEIGLCANHGNAPGSDRRCDLGIVACFTCPNGYRTIDHVPGLLAAVEFADIIEANDPDEWTNGAASDLRFYAQATLDAFPTLVVENIRARTDLTPHILTVTGMYLEMRHG